MQLGINGLEVAYAGRCGLESADGDIFSPHCHGIPGLVVLKHRQPVGGAERLRTLAWEVVFPRKPDLVVDLDTVRKRLGIALGLKTACIGLCAVGRAMTDTLRRCTTSGSAIARFRPAGRRNGIPRFSVALATLRHNGTGDYWRSAN